MPYGLLKEETPGDWSRQRGMHTDCHRLALWYQTTLK